MLVFETATFPGDPLIEESQRAALESPHISIATDSILLGYGLPSHLFYDCFPKFLSENCIRRPRLTLAEGIRKCTSLPAAQLGLERRGLLRPNYAADLVLLDPMRLASHSTTSDPRHFPSGIDCVVVNGQVLLDENGFHPARKPGRILRRGQA